MVCWKDNSLLEVQLLQDSRLLLLEGGLCRMREEAEHFWWFPSRVRHPVLGLFVPSSGPGYPFRPKITLRKVMKPEWRVSPEPTENTGQFP